MTTSVTLTELRNKCGECDVAVALHELEHGTAPSPEYDALLWAAADAKSALRAAYAQETGHWNHELFHAH